MKIIYLFFVISAVFMSVKADNNKIVNTVKDEVVKNEVLSNSKRNLADNPITYQIKICGTIPDKPTETTTTPEATTTTTATTKPEVTTTDDEILVSSSAPTDDEQETPTEEDDKEKVNRLLAEEQEFNITDKIKLEEVIKDILGELYPEDVTIQKVEIPTIEEPFSLIINITLENSNTKNEETIKNLNLEISSNNNDTFYNKLIEKTNNIYNKCKLQETTTCQYKKQYYKYITSEGKTHILPVEGSKPIEGSCTNKTKTIIDEKSGNITIYLSTELERSLCTIQCRDYLKNDGYGVVSIKIINEDDISTDPVFKKLSYPVMVYLNEPFNTVLTLEYPNSDIENANDNEEEINKNDNNNKNKNNDNDVIEEFTIEMAMNEESDNLTMNEQESTHTTEFNFTNINITIKENNTFTLEKGTIELIYRNDSNLHVFYSVNVTVLSQPCPDPDEMGVCCVHQPGELCSNLTLSFSFIDLRSRRLLADENNNDNNNDVKFRNDFKDALDEAVFTPQNCASSDISTGTTLTDPLVLSIKKNGGNNNEDSSSSSNSSPNKITKIITLEEAFRDIISKIEKIQKNEIPEVAKVLTDNQIVLNPEVPITYGQIISNTELPPIQSLEPSENQNNNNNNPKESNWAKDNWYVILIVVVVVLLLIIGSVFGSLYVIKKKKYNNNSSSSLPTNFHSIPTGNSDNNNSNKNKNSKSKKKYQVGDGDDKQVNEKHQSIEDLEPVGDNVVGKVSIDINNNSKNNNNYNGDDEDNNDNITNKKPIKYEGYLEKEMPGRTTDEWILRYCVLYANPSILYVYESMKPSYKGNIYTGVKQIIPLDSVKTVEYDKRQNRQSYDFNIVMLDNDQQVQSNECMEDLKYVHLRIPNSDYATTVNSFNEWINYLTADEKPNMVKDAWGGNDDDDNAYTDNYISDNGEDEEDQLPQPVVGGGTGRGGSEEDAGDVKIEFNEEENEKNDQQEKRPQSPPQPPPRKIQPPSPSSPPQPPPRKMINETPDKVSLPVGRVKAHRDIGLRDDP